jgi:hypothetical protein
VNETELTTPGADPYADHDAIRELVRRKRDEWGRGREDFIRAAYRNILFYRGKQWIKWDRGTNRFRPAVVPSGTPTPITNVFAPTMDAVNAVFARIEPRLNFAPGNPEEPEDRAAADVATRAISVVEDEVSIRTQRQMLAAWVGLTGQAWLENGYDPSPEHGMVTMDVEHCPACDKTQAPGAGMCETCGGETVPQQTEAPRGKQYVDVCSIFEMFFDASVTEWTKQRAYIREKSVPEDECKARWPHLKDEIKGHMQGSMDEWYAGALPTLGPSLDDSQQSRLLAQTTQRHQGVRVMEQWYWQLPDETYPQGLLAIVLGRAHVAHAGPLPYGALQNGGDRKPFLPTVHFPQHLVPGTAFAKTVADDVALLQAKRNRWESICEAAGMRIGSPVWLEPVGCNVSNLTGDPGQRIKYQTIPGSPGVKPERIAGQGIPLSFIQRIEKIDQEIEQVAATFDVIKGSKPEGVSAGIALQILQERGMSRFGPLFILWEAAWAQQAYQMLEIFRQFATEERLLRIKGRDGAWEVQKFIGADLAGRVDVIPEAGSSMPRSTMVERAEMEQAVGLRLLNPGDPETRFHMLEKFGMTHMLSSLKADTKNAIMDNEAFTALAQDPTLAQAVPEDVDAIRQMDYPMVEQQMQLRGVKIPRVWPGLDDHATHSREHANFGKSETFRKLPEIVQALFEKHKEYHDSLMLAQAQAMQGLQPGQQQGGFMAKPAAMQQPMNTSSSPQRMAGDYGEMEEQYTATPGGGE